VRDGRYEGEVYSVRKDASQFWSSVVITPMRDETGTLVGFAKICRDVTERRRNEARLYHLAHIDTLTQLPNRLALRERLDRLEGRTAPHTADDGS
jgi:predicted signal transduction protein with EAL and GGDEF domain